MLVYMVLCAVWLYLCYVHKDQIVTVQHFITGTIVFLMIEMACEWASYHPGPRTRPDWARPTPPAFSPDLLLADSLTPEMSRFRLLTPLDG